MLEQLIGKRDKDHDCDVIGAYVDSFAAHLSACDYAPATIRSQLKLLGHLNEWLIRRRCAIHQLNDELVAGFLKGCTRRGRGDAKTLRQFLIHLRTRGVLAPLTQVVDDSPLAQLQREYARYLTAERGLAPSPCRAISMCYGGSWPSCSATARWTLAPLRCRRSRRV